MEKLIRSMVRSALRESGMRRKDASHPWIGAFLRGVARTIQLEPGWDSYSARPIEREPVVAAMSFLERAMSRGKIPRPQLVPCSNGGVQLEWHEGGIDLEIEFYPGGSGLAFEDAETGEELYLDGPAAKRALSRKSSAWLARILERRTRPAEAVAP